MGAIAKIATRGQTTIPQPIRETLRLSPGDGIVWELDADGTARVRRLPGHDIATLRALEATLGAWTSAEDRNAYRDL
jgi:AbrB family looped-hinge helix DNA binding protein